MVVVGSCMRRNRNSVGLLVGLILVAHVAVWAGPGVGTEHGAGLEVVVARRQPVELMPLPTSSCLVVKCTIESLMPVSLIRLDSYVRPSCPDGEKWLEYFITYGS